MQRCDGRTAGQIRPVKITRGFVSYAEGSCLIEIGETRVICTASVEEKVPIFLKNSGKGWVTAEYGMIPRACRTRNQREVTKGQPGGRTMEIQRLIGRSLRSVFDMDSIGERTIWLDCDVIQADGGTRTASITGAFVALVDAINKLRAAGLLARMPVTDFVAATSVGRVDGEVILDLRYVEDSAADVDMNIVMTGAGRFVEVQGTGEEASFDRREMNKMIDLAAEGINRLIAVQKEVLGATAADIGEGKNNEGGISNK
ncbi:MAG TPA: ribonuclease PH [Armatimonadetes bacterium]|nr:ribonuclease PH [Armatimonadota bacterium]